jgi:alkylhydroperoxidase/carboxymuconolactone decarboxylase family protein YurZ
MSVGATPEETLRGLTLGDGAVAQEILRLQADNLTESALDKKSFAVARIAALVALGADESSFVMTIGVATEWGVTADDVAGVLIALAPVVGTARIMQAAPKVAAALAVASDA